MDIKKILELWEEDSKISGTSLDEDSRKTPQLHAKYLGYLADAKMQKTRAEMQQKSLLKDKWLWYNGKMDEETMKSKNWSPDPFNGLKVLKGDLEKYYYDADKEIQDLFGDHAEYFEQMVQKAYWDGVRKAQH